MSNPGTNVPLPSALETALNSIRRRSIGYCLIRALAIGVSVTLIAMAAAMMIDAAATLFDTRIRWFLTLATLSIGLGSLLIVAARGWRGVRRPIDAARVAENRVPELEERWLTMVSLAASNPRPMSAVSRAMLEQVRGEAVALEGLVRPGRVVAPAVLRTPLAICCLCVVLFAAFLASNWSRTSVLLSRFWQPGAEITMTRLDNVTGSVFAPRGEILELVCRQSGAMRSAAELTIQHETGGREVVEVDHSRDRSEHFAHTLRAADSFRYRFEAGDARTPWKSVTVIDYPELQDVRLQVTAPAYVNRPAYERSTIPSRIRVLEGSVLSLAMRPVEPLAVFELKLSATRPGEPPLTRSLALEHDADGFYHFQASLFQDFEFTPALSSPHGLTNERPTTCRIQVVPDLPPVARIISPNDSLAAAGDEAVEIRFEAHDDLGIAGAELVLYDESAVATGGEPRVIETRPIDLGEQFLQRHILATARLDLSELHLPEGSQIGFSIRVADNRRLPVDPEGFPAALETSTSGPADASSEETLPGPLAAGEEAPRDEREPGPNARDSDSGDVESSAPASLPFAASEEVEPATVVAESPPSTESSQQSPPAETAAALSQSDQVQEESPESATPLMPPASQLAESAQNTETQRLTLTIASRLAVASTSVVIGPDYSRIREAIADIALRITAAETDLRNEVDQEDAGAIDAPFLDQLDERLGEIQRLIGQLRNDTRDTDVEFVGLQLVEIDFAQIARARERVYEAIRDAAVAGKSAVAALHHLTRARELLDALLSQYDEINRDRELQRALDEAITMYDVYVENVQLLLREARQDRHPLERRMAVVEVDQDYLTRYAEVLRLRQELMQQFARMLADDPRLRSRYMDLISRRRASLRDQLATLHERQEEIAVELSGWLAIGDDQRPYLWTLIAEMRLRTIESLAGDAARLAERVQQQLPLTLDEQTGPAAMAAGHARELAYLAREAMLEASQVLRDDVGDSESEKLVEGARILVERYREVEASLESLRFRHADDQEVNAFVTARLLEARVVGDLADAWIQIALGLKNRDYALLSEVDQQSLAVETELLRVEMLDLDTELDGEFQQVTGNAKPDEVTLLVRELRQIVEEITYHQYSATFALSRNLLERAESEQLLASRKFETAEDLFDDLRRIVVSILDEYDVDDPDIADLVDPTLDEFLARLEREPNLEALLGIPGRPRNLRALEEWIATQRASGGMLSDVAGAAMQRIRDGIQQRFAMERQEDPDASLTDEQRAEREREQEMQQELERALTAVNERLQTADPASSERERLEQAVEGMERMLAQLSADGVSAGDWQRIADADQTRATLQALARGEEIPDQQWNRLLSMLDDGLWQVRGRTPPVEYRGAVEQYQDQIRLFSTFDEAAADADAP